MISVSFFSALLDNLFYLRYVFELQLAKQDSKGQSYFPLHKVVHKKIIPHEHWA